MKSISSPLVLAEEIDDLWKDIESPTCTNREYFRRAVELEAKCLGVNKWKFRSLEYWYHALVNPKWSSIFLYRVAVYHKLRGHGRLAVIFTRMNHILNGCDISINAQIAPPCFFQHSRGIVIGENVKIGPNCQFHGNCLLGRDPLELGGKDQYPRLGRGVFIGPGAVLLGGIEIGNDAVIGALARVSFSVPERVIVSSPSAQIKRNLTENEDPQYRIRRSS